VYGVSPAFVLSACGEDFTPDDFCACLERIAALGFDAFQPEVFHRERLPEWLAGGARLLSARGRDLNLSASQFVAHFLTPCLASAASLRSDEDADELKRTIELAACFENCRVVTLPVGPWQSAPGDAEAYAELSGRFRDKLAALLEIAAAADFYLALEILPYSFPGGSEGFLRLHRELASPRLGLNFDTGHAWACKEALPLLPAKLSGSIFGTHLCDNSGGENLSLVPGAGTIDWPAVLASLKSSGYTDSLDLEIRTSPGEVEAAYGAGLSRLKELEA
jgi:sugar phosphate isomerase/epimerase